MRSFGATALINRRSFLKAAGAGFAAALCPSAAASLDRQNAVFATAYGDFAGGYGVALLGEDGAILHRYGLPARGHDLVRQPGTESIVVFARRPGTFAVVFDMKRQTKPHVMASADGRHFYGHGAFSADGQLLYATENDFDAARGVIGIYDATDSYKRIGEFDTFGIGPHDMAMLPDGRTMVIANGGIETHPDCTRVKLNLPTMAPNLAFIDVRDGSLIACHKLPAAMHKLSIRHLALDDNGQIWFACQNQGDIAEPMPLVGRASAKTGAFEMLELPLDETRALRGYVGSIETNDETGHVAITSPRGGVALQFDPATGSIVQSLRKPDVCGVAPVGTGFAFSSGEGVFAGNRHDIGFDNHIMPLNRTEG